MKIREQNMKKGAGGKLSRSETVTVRLDPKLRYLAELAARKQRRTLSSFIEWAIEQALPSVEVTAIDIKHKEHSSNFGHPEMTRWLWDIDEADRLVRLWTHFPDLLTYDEQRIWKIVSESATFGGVVKEDTEKMALLRRNWPLVLRLAAEGKTAAELDSGVAEHG